MKKTYLIIYDITNRRGASRDYRKIIETDDLEKYLKDNDFYMSYQGRGYKHFQCASEIEKVGFDNYKYVQGGEYWYAKLVTLFEGKLIKSKIKWGVDDVIRMR